MDSLQRNERSDRIAAVPNASSLCDGGDRWLNSIPRSCKTSNIAAARPQAQGGPMQIQALGYVGVAAQGLDDWAHFGTRFLGMQQVDRTQKRMALRMDDRKQRVIIEDHGHNGLGFLGWETADQAALEARSAWDMPCFRSRASMRSCRSIAMCWDFTRATTCNSRSRRIFFMSTRASTVSRCCNWGGRVSTTS